MIPRESLAPAGFVRGLPNQTSTRVGCGVGQDDFPGNLSPVHGLYAEPVDTLEPVPGVGSGGVVPGESPQPLGVDAWGRAAPPPELAPYLARVNEALESEGAPATKRATASDWAKFERWCSHRSLTPLPAHPITVCLYLLSTTREN